MALRQVVKAHRASYVGPIRVAVGGRLALSGQEEFWDGHRWLWATGPDGREGWVPDDLIDPDGATARYNYSATELACRKGEMVEVLEETHGWAWCRNAAGCAGWVPLSSLRPSRSDDRAR